MQKTLDDILADLHSMSLDTEIELWIVLNRATSYLGVDNVQKMTRGEAEKVWACVSEIITRMLSTGFLAVDLTAHGGFKTWPDQDPKQVLTQIKNKWIEYKGEFPNVGYIVWFVTLTDAEKQTLAQGKG